jgi:hypothetical protein
MAQQWDERTPTAVARSDPITALTILDNVTKI